MDAEMLAAERTQIVGESCTRGATELAAGG